MATQINILIKIIRDDNQHIFEAAIGEYDGISNDDDIFYWFDDFNNILGDHEDFTVLGFEINEGQNFGFEHEGQQITNPLLDKAGKMSVNPVIYYQDNYSNYMIAKHKAIFNVMLSNLNLCVDIWVTDECYGDEDDLMDEEDEYFGLPMYEARIDDEDGEEIEDTYTGRYCDISSVIEELNGYVANVIEKASEIARAKAGENACAESLETYFDDSKYTYNEDIMSTVFDPESQAGMLETYGDDYVSVKAITHHSPKKIWSVVDGDDDKIHVVAGSQEQDVVYFIVTNEDWEYIGETYFLGGE